MEYRDLYDENKILTGEKIRKDDVVPNGKYYITVVVWIENYRGEFLLQINKKYNMWATTGGHPKSGETSLEGIINETNEELGIEIKNPILFKQASGKNTFCDLYYIKQDVDLNKITIQKTEVEEVTWATSKKIDELMKNGEFNKGHYMMFQDCLDFLNK